MAKSPEELVLEANKRLKAAKTGITIELRGAKLYLRGMLPHDRLGKSQQRITLGYFGNPSGIRRAEADALKVASDLIQERFNWAEWREGGKLPTTIGETIDRFKAEYLKTRSETAWQNYYSSTYKWLNPEAELKESELVGVFERSAQTSRTRAVQISGIQLLANYAGLNLDLASYKSSYKLDSLKEREIPSDKLIIECFHGISNPLWRNAYALYAVYGIRNHELFHVEFALPKIKILEGKTGARLCYPIPIEWLELFNVTPDMPLPQSKRSTNKGKGQMVSCFFRRAQLPFSIYALRHAWAIRAIHHGISDTIAAKAQGHTVEVHNTIYQRWIAERDMDAAFKIDPPRS